MTSPIQDLIDRFRSHKNVTVEPSNKLVLPYSGLSNTQASSVRQMFHITPELSTIQWQYSIGIRSNLSPITYTVVNDTLNASLAITLHCGSILTIDGDNFVTIPPRGQHTFSFSFNEAEARIRASSNEKTFQDVISFEMSPFGYTGPVFLVDGTNRVLTDIETVLARFIDANGELNFDISDTAITQSLRKRLQNLNLPSTLYPGII